MKQIKIHGYQSSLKDGYSLYLGNGTVQQFLNKKQAMLFVSNTNKFLTKKLYELRTLYIDIWTSHQRSWGYYQHNKKSMSSALHIQLASSTRLLIVTDNAFELSVERSGWPNGNYFVFVHLNSAILNLKQVVINLNKVYSNKSATIEHYTLDSFFDRLNTIETEIDRFGQQRASLLVKTPIHLKETETGKKYSPPFAQIMKVVS